MVWVMLFLNVLQRRTPPCAVVWSQAVSSWDAPPGRPSGPRGPRGCRGSASAKVELTECFQPVECHHFVTSKIPKQLDEKKEKVAGLNPSLSFGFVTYVKYYITWPTRILGLWFHGSKSQKMMAVLVELWTLPEISLRPKLVFPPPRCNKNNISFDGLLFNANQKSKSWGPHLIFLSQPGLKTGFVKADQGAANTIGPSLETETTSPGGIHV